MTNITFLYTIAPDEKTAEVIAAALIKARLAACVNFFPGMKSVYRWKDAVETATETAMIVKTTAGAAEAASALICELHPYETPAVASIAADGPGLAPAFAEWIAAEVATP